MVGKEMEHAVHARRKSDGRWELKAPEVTHTIAKAWFFFKYYKISTDHSMGRLDSVELARKVLESGDYQDVIVLKDRGDLSPICIWENGKWIERIETKVNKSIYRYPW